MVDLDRFTSYIMLLVSIKVPPGRNYPRDFYKMTMEKMDRVYEQNGIFVLLLHPEYFGFLPTFSIQESH